MSKPRRKETPTLDDYANNTTEKKKEVAKKIAEALEETENTPAPDPTEVADRVLKKIEEKEKQEKEKQKQKLPRYSTIQELVTAKETRAYMKKRLAYKNWTLFVFKNNGRFTLKVTARRGDRVYTRINIQLTDARYVRELLEEIETLFKKLGFTLSQIQ